MRVGRYYAADMAADVVSVVINSADNVFINNVSIREYICTKIFLA